MLRHVLLTQVMNQICDLPQTTLDHEEDNELILERIYECLEETRTIDNEGPLYEALQLMQDNFPSNPDNIATHLQMMIKEFS